MLMNRRPYDKKLPQNSYGANRALNGWFGLINSNGCPDRAETENQYYDDGEPVTTSNILRRAFSQPVVRI